MTAEPATTPPATPAKPARSSTKTPPRGPGQLRRRLASWSPDPRWAHPLAAAGWCHTLAVIVTATAVPPLALAVVAPISAALARARARRAWPELTHGEDLARSMSWLGAVASAAAAGWLVYAGYAGPWWSLGWLALLTVWFGGWYAVLRTSAPKVAAEIATAREEARVAAMTATWNELLAAAGLGLRVAEASETRAGYVLGVEPVDPGKPVSFDTLKSRLPDLTTRAAAALAREGITVSAGTIRAEETDAAHVHLVHVCTKHILRETIPFEPFAQAPGTIADLLDFALFEDGQEVAVCFGGDLGGTNGKIVGATGSGKSRVLNSLIGRIGECGDVLVGVVASSKLTPAVYPWLRPWIEGRTERPALDFVAGQDPANVLLMLAAIYQIVVERNARLANESTHVPTVREPAIVVFVEEAGALATRDAKVRTHDGQEVGFSQLVHLILRECRSAQVSVQLVNQTDLYGSLGAFGPEIARNTPLRICLKTVAPQDGQSVLPGLGSWGDTAKLRHNSMLVQPSIDEPRVMPAKAYNLAGELIDPVATRNAGWRPELEPALVELLGEVWTERWDAERLPELAAAAAADRLVWPVGRVEDEMDVELRKMLEGKPPVTETPAPETTTPEAPEVASPSSGLPDVADDLAALRAAGSQPAIVLPEPLGAVVALMRDERFPADWISTRQLAILLDRVPADAPEEELREAARKLGRALAAVDDELRAVPRDRRQGYETSTLRAVAARLARGGR